MFLKRRIIRSLNRIIVFCLSIDIAIDIALTQRQNFLKLSKGRFPWKPTLRVSNSSYVHVRMYI